MTRVPTPGKRVAILATGDEIISGDILNTNAQRIASRLTDAHMLPSTQMVVADHIQDIEGAILWLLEKHDCLIITGGLGPTSDDLTRVALANATDRPLIFHDTVWDNILARLKHFGYAHPPESNRQQALFPKGADIIQNAAGTAAGCRLTLAEKIIFMLPGPPGECLPMVDNTVLPALQQAGFSRPLFGRRWLLFGASEGQIAESLDHIAHAGQCHTGYRLCYPYVEFKLFAEDETALTNTTRNITEKISDFLIGDGRKTASEWFYEKCVQSGKKLSFCDQATGGILESTLKTPESTGLFTFGVPANTADIHITGLQDYWQGTDHIHTHLSLRFPLQTKVPEITAEIPFRGAKVRLYATEWVCQALVQAGLLHNWLILQKYPA